MDEKSIEQLKQTFDHIEEEKNHDGHEQAPAENISPDEAKLHEEIDSLYYGDGVSEYSRGSR